MDKKVSKGMNKKAGKTKIENKNFPWKLGIYPLLELVFFIAANMVSNPLLSLIFVVIAGVMLSFSIHIFFHECVHVREEFPMPINIINTIFLGLPFDGYRVHHYNHHTYANGLKDFSSTWYIKNSKKTAFSACRYTFGWLQQLSKAMQEPKPFNEKLGDVAVIKARIYPQKLTLFFFCLLLAFIGLKTFILYFILVYFGWAFSSLHNYGQHPPIQEELICTYENKLYNRVTFNNGLHWEHHDKPWLSWEQLEIDKKSSRINHPHLIQPCFFTRNT